MSLACDKLSDILAGSSGTFDYLGYTDEIAVEVFEDNVGSMNPGADISTASRINGTCAIDDDGQQINARSSVEHGVELLHKRAHRLIVIHVDARHHEGHLILHLRTSSATLQLASGTC